MKKKRKEITRIEIPMDIYRMNVVIYLGWEMEAIIKDAIKHGVEPNRFDGQWRRWFSDNAETAMGLCMDLGEGNKDVMVWVKKKPKTLNEYCHLYHELYHATDHIADSRNFNVEDKMSEPKAYIFEYLFRFASNILWK